MWWGVGGWVAEALGEERDGLAGDLAEGAVCGESRVILSFEDELASLHIEESKRVRTRMVRHTAIQRPHITRPQQSSLLSKAMGFSVWES